MKLLVLSDLHVELAPFAPDMEALQAADAVVLAGDIHNAKEACRWIAATFKAKPVLYVAGNHEFYRGDWDDALVELRDTAAQHGVHFLENDNLRLLGVRFLGCTLWTDFEYFGPQRRSQAMVDYGKGLNDCHLITARSLPGVNNPSEHPKLTPAHVLHRHRDSYDWLSRELHDRSGPLVVVTHHLPTRRSVPSAYVQDKLTPGFASNLPDSILASADVWIHGHSHGSADYVIRHDDREVRVVCNPRGYPKGRRALRFENPAFRDDLLIEI